MMIGARTNDFPKLLKNIWSFPKHTMKYKGFSPCIIASVCFMEPAERHQEYNSLPNWNDNNSEFYTRAYFAVGWHTAWLSHEPHTFFPPHLPATETAIYVHLLAARPEGRHK